MIDAESAPPLEAEPSWFTSRHSTGNGGECVEVAVRDRAVYVTDSKDPGGPVLHLTPESWSAFVDFARRWRG